MAKQLTTFEQDVLNKVGSGILQSRLKMSELPTALKLCEYPNNHLLRPRLMTIHTDEGTKVVPYVKKGVARNNIAAIERLKNS